MQKWEYMSFELSIYDSPEDKLNQFGALGWELVSATGTSYDMVPSSGNPKKYRYVLKRAKS